MNQSLQVIPQTEEDKLEEFMPPFSRQASRRPTIREIPKNLYVDPEEESEDRHVYSKTKLLAPHSYMSENVLLANLNGQAPPPTY